MPVRKFRSVEAMNQPVWRDPRDPELVSAMRSLWEFWRRTSPLQFKPGVYKYRSIEEATSDHIRLPDPRNRR